MFSALIVGCGNISGAQVPIKNTTHGGVFWNHPSINIIACVDTVLNKTVQFSKTYNCSPFTSLGKALNTYAPDIISVCTPDCTHYEIARQILLSAKPPRVLFIEKPICSNRQQYDELLLLSRCSPTLVIVNHSRRFDDHISIIRQAYQSNFFGSLFSVRCCYYSGWLHNGSHVVDTLSYLFDDHLVLDSVIKSSPSP